MTHFKSFMTYLCIVCPFLLVAQVETVFNNILFNDSVEDVKAKISSITGDYELFNATTSSFPLAKNEETHMVCTKVTTSHGILDKVVFTFADDKLVYIEAKGNVDALKQTQQDAPRTYIDYEVYFKDKLFIKSSEDSAWILNDEGMHVNLFAWENPYLKTPIIENKSHKSLPSFIKMGASLEEMAPILKSKSQFTHTEKLDGKSPDAQLQINAFGVHCFGFPRKLEARFGDEKLNVVWILTGKAEEDRIRQVLIATYGRPIFVDDNWEIFNDWQVGLRKDKPEVLLMEKALGQVYKKEFFKQ